MKEGKSKQFEFLQLRLLLVDDALQQVQLSDDALLLGK